MLPLADIEKSLALSDDRTTLVFPFEVPQGIRLLSLHMIYSPVWLEDKVESRRMIQRAMRTYAPWEPVETWQNYLPLSNLITLSLDDPMGYRGNAHRKAGKQTHTLSAEAASPGFYAGPIHAGTWRACVHIHSQVTKDCGFSLSIQGVNA